MPLSIHYKPCCFFFVQYELYMHQTEGLRLLGGVGWGHILTVFLSKSGFRVGPSHS